jgi:hypothetical protein
LTPISRIAKLHDAKGVLRYENIVCGGSSPSIHCRHEDVRVVAVPWNVNPDVAAWHLEKCLRLEKEETDGTIPEGVHRCSNTTMS